MLYIYVYFNLYTSYIIARTLNQVTIEAMASCSAQHSTSAPTGLANGVLLRTEVDTVTGQLSDTRQRFLGTRPPKLCAAMVRGKRAMLALSSRPWLGYSDMGRYNLTPLSYEALDDAASAHLLSLDYLFQPYFQRMPPLLSKGSEQHTESLTLEDISNGTEQGSLRCLAYPKPCWHQRIWHSKLVES